MTSLETWLASATQGLSAESAAQVRAEIEEHYQSAYDAALSTGVSEPEASLSALTALGDAKSANRQYRHVLLTAKEAKRLELMSLDLSSFPSSRRWPGRILVIEAFGFAAMVSWRDHGQLFFWLPLVALTLVQRFLPIDTPARGRLYRWAKWGLFMVGTALAVWFVMPWWIPLPALLLFAYMEWVRMPIRRKLPVSQWPKRLFR